MDIPVADLRVTLHQIVRTEYLTGHSCIVEARIGGEIVARLLIGREFEAYVDAVIELTGDSPWMT